MAITVAPAPEEKAGVLSQAVAKVALRLDLNTNELNEILGISQSSASRLMKGAYALRESGKEWELAALLVRLYRGLYSIVGNNDELVRAWLRSPNNAFDRRTPFEVIKTASGLVHACDYVDAHRSPS